MNDLEKKLTPEERAQSLQDFHDRQAETIRKGRHMVFAFAIINAILQALQFFMPNDWLSRLVLVAGLLVSVALLLGGKGVKYILGAYALLMTWQVMMVMYYASSTRAGYSADEVIGVALANIIWLVVLARGLLFNKSVAEYMYMKQNKTKTSVG